MSLVGQYVAANLDHFGKMVRNNYLLVDKSLLVQDFLESRDEVCLITRPRRFGKSLNLSMLQHFLAASVNGQVTQHLFDEFAIARINGGSFLQKHQGQYPVRAI
jgi:hypothetical protein